MRDKVLIYCDYGCENVGLLEETLRRHFEPRGAQVGLVDAAGIIKEDALDDNVLAFFMGGGASTPYRMKLKHFGNAKIRGYVAKGGVYFGICAGAYYGSRRVEFEADIPQISRVSDDNLGLLETTAKGTLYKEYGIKPYSREADSAAVARLRWLEDGAEYAAHYHGGPYFIPDSKDAFEVLAVYDDIPGEKPAIVRGKFGAGEAIFSGVHFENTGAYLGKLVHNLQSDEAIARRNVSRLAEKEPQRRALESRLMEMVGKKGLNAR